MIVERSSKIAYPGEGIFYGNSLRSKMEVWKHHPPPGFALGESYSTAQNMIGCFGISDGGYVESMLLKGRVVTMNSESDVINDGSVLVQNGKITAVWSGQNIPQNVDLTGVPVIETNGTIYPGLIDSHNHMHYNHIPLWDFEVHTSQKSEEGGYSNRNQWKNNPNYKRDISWMKTFVHTSSMWDMSDPADEIRRSDGGCRRCHRCTRFALKQFRCLGQYAIKKHRIVQLR